MLPFAFLDEMNVSIALRTDLLFSIDLNGVNPDFIKIHFKGQGARTYWSPALQRCLRQTITRTDSIVKLVKLWRRGLNRELDFRPNESAQGGKFAQMVLHAFDSMMLIGRRATLIL